MTAALWALKNWKLIVAGIGVAVLAFMLFSAKHEAAKWERRTHAAMAQVEEERAAHLQTITNFRTAAYEAAKADAENKRRVEREVKEADQRRVASYEKRIADARAAAERLRREARAIEADPGRGGTSPVPGVPDPPGRVGEAPCDCGLSDAERLIATEQAIQLDELISWLKEIAGIDFQGE